VLLNFIEMKKLLFFILALSVFLSCRQDIIVEDGFVSTELSNSWIKPNQVYLYNGEYEIVGYELLSQENDSSNILIGYGDVPLYFINDAAMRSWTFGDADRAHIRSKMDSVDMLRAFEQLDNGEEMFLAAVPWGPGTLYSGYNRTGNSWPWAMPNYGEYNNQASSFLIIMRTGMLASKTWLWGRKVWMLGYPGFGGNLNDPQWDFDNKARSGALF
jgi:hypothetical protein